MNIMIVARIVSSNRILRYGTKNLKYVIRCEFIDLDDYSDMIEIFMSSMIEIIFVACWFFDGGSHTKLHTVGWMEECCKRQPSRLLSRAFPLSLAHTYSFILGRTLNLPLPMGVAGEEKEHRSFPLVPLSLLLFASSIRLKVSLTILRNSGDSSASRLTTYVPVAFPKGGQMVRDWWKTTLGQSKSRNRR